MSACVYCRVSVFAKMPDCQCPVVAVCAVQRWPGKAFAVYYHLHEDWTKASMRRGTPTPIAAAATGGAPVIDDDNGSVRSFLDVDCCDLDLDLLFSMPPCDSSLDNMAILSSFLG